MSDLPISILRALEAVRRECWRVAETTQYNTAHDDKHTDKSLAEAAEYLLMDYLTPPAGTDIVRCRINLAKNLRRDPWPAIFADKAFNSQVTISRLKMAGQFIVAEIARLLREQEAK